MTRIHKFATVGALMAVFALISSALAVASPRAAYRAGVRASSAKNVPNTNIKGHPAHFKPKRLSAKAHWTTPPTCTTAQISFTIKNHESKTEIIDFKGTGGFTPFEITMPGKTETGICITKGYHGTLTGKLTDGKKLKVNF